MMVNIIKMLKYVFQTNNEITFAHHISASGGNEAMIANLTEPGDTVIFAVAGFWGERIFQFGERYGKLNINTIRKNIKRPYFITKLI